MSSFWTNVAIDVLLAFYVFDCILMCLVVLMQRSKQEGLGAAFGGGFTSEILGAGTSAFLVKTTVVLAALFFIFSIALAQLYSHREALVATEKGSHSLMQQELLNPVAPAATNAAPSTNAAPITPSASTKAPASPAVTIPAASSSTNAPASPAPAKPTK